jgi:hypothetical protein
MASFQIVNGFVCFDCSDVALAKKDVNPAHPPESPNDPASSPNGAPSGSSNTQSTPAVSFGGSLSQLSGASAVQQPGATTQASPADASPYNPTNGAKLSVTA